MTNATSARPKGHSRATASFAIRFVGALFVYAGLLKAIDPFDIGAVATFYHIPQSLTTTFVWGITLGEATLGMLLIFQPLNTKLLTFTFFLLVIYTMHIANLLRSETAPNCGCISLIRHFENGRRWNVAALARNIVLLCGVGIVCFSRMRRRDAYELSV